MSDAENVPQVTSGDADQKAEQVFPKKCGIVMPISASEEYSENHWVDVLEIIKESLDKRGFEINLVSNARDSGVIHKRIVENLYNDPIVVCDVSSRNPNVMFELGLRLAFDKPTVIVKDDITPFSFDTSIIEHISYPRDLRHNKIKIFQNQLGEKVEATYELASNDTNYSTFLKHFVNLKPGEFLSKEIPDVESLIHLLKREVSGTIGDLASSVKDLKREFRFLRVRNKNDIPSSFKEVLNKSFHSLTHNYDTLKLEDSNFSEPRIIYVWGGEKPENAEKEVKNSKKDKED
jgi:hypothetical protein